MPWRRTHLPACREVPIGHKRADLRAGRKRGRRCRQPRLLRRARGGRARRAEALPRRVVAPLSALRRALSPLRASALCRRAVAGRRLRARSAVGCPRTLARPPRPRACRRPRRLTGPPGRRRGWRRGVAAGWPEPSGGGGGARGWRERQQQAPVRRNLHPSRQAVAHQEAYRAGGTGAMRPACMVNKLTH